MTNTGNSAVLCYVALGSNIGDTKSHLSRATAALKMHPQINFLNISRLYLSKPHGPQDQQDYLNAAVSFETEMPAEALLDVLQAIENDNGRVRKNVERWGARTLDLDILFYANEAIESKRLTVPHPRICERAFVIYPLLDLIKNPDDLKINKTTTLQDCIDQLCDQEKKNIEVYNG